LDEAPGPLWGINFAADRNYYFLVLSITILMIYLATNLTRTKLGRALVAVRDNDIAAEVMGINIATPKSWPLGSDAFSPDRRSSGGAYYEYVNIEWFGLDDSIWFLGFLVVGGFGSIFGAIAGARFGKSWTNSARWSLRWRKHSWAGRFLCSAPSPGFLFFDHYHLPGFRTAGIAIAGR